MKRSPDAASEGVCDSAYAGLRGPRPASSLTVPSPCRYDYCVAPEDPEVVPSFWQRGGPFLVARDTVGGGLEIVLHCVVRFASRSARLGQPEINIGFLPPVGATQ